MPWAKLFQLRARKTNQTAVPREFGVDLRRHFAKLPML
jgi:hypothetical protein